MSLWEELELKQENAKPFKIENMEDLTTKDFIRFMCYDRFGGICNEEEITNITDIVYKAYLRKEKNNE